MPAKSNQATLNINPENSAEPKKNQGNDLYEKLKNFAQTEYSSLDEQAKAAKNLRSDSSWDQTSEKDVNKTKLQEALQQLEQDNLQEQFLNKFLNGQKPFRDDKADIPEDEDKEQKKKELTEGKLKKRIPTLEELKKKDDEQITDNIKFTASKDKKTGESGPRLTFDPSKASPEEMRKAVDYMIDNMGYSEIYLNNFTAKQIKAAQERAQERGIKCNVKKVHNPSIQESAKTGIFNTGRFATLAIAGGPMGVLAYFFREHSKRTMKSPNASSPLKHAYQMGDFAKNETINNKMSQAGKQPAHKYYSEGMKNIRGVTTKDQDLQNNIKKAKANGASTLYRFKNKHDVFHDSGKILLQRQMKNMNENQCAMALRQLYNNNLKSSETPNANQLNNHKDKVQEAYIKAQNDPKEKNLDNLDKVIADRQKELSKREQKGELRPLEKQEKQELNKISDYSKSQRTFNDAYENISKDKNKNPNKICQKAAKGIDNQKEFQEFKDELYKAAKSSGLEPPSPGGANQELNHDQQVGARLGSSQSGS